MVPYFSHFYKNAWHFEVKHQTYLPVLLAQNTKLKIRRHSVFIKCGYKFWSLREEEECWRAKSFTEIMLTCHSRKGTGRKNHMSFLVLPFCSLWHCLGHPFVFNWAILTVFGDTKNWRSSCDVCEICVIVWSHFRAYYLQVADHVKLWDSHSVTKHLERMWGRIISACHVFSAWKWEHLFMYWGLILGYLEYFFRFISPFSTASQSETILFTLLHFFTYIYFFLNCKIKKCYSHHLQSCKKCCLFSSL